jgi:urease accessory protein
MSAPLQRARGQGHLSTKERDGRTRLDSLFQHGCAKIRLPNTHSQALEAVLINTAGGLTGGDRIDWSAEIEAHGHAVLTTQACERSYRSTGDTAHIHVGLKVGGNAHLDWLPQETILFAGSKLQRRLDVDLEPGASLTAIEAILIGRDAMGEDARDAQLRDNWRIRRDGRLIHAEASLLTGAGPERDGISLLNDNRAFATILHVAADTESAQERADRLREMMPEGQIGLSATGERLIIRAMAPSGLALRRMIVPFLVELTGAGSLPRLWHL